MGIVHAAGPDDSGLVPCLLLLGPVVIGSGSGWSGRKKRPTRDLVGWKVEIAALGKTPLMRKVPLDLCTLVLHTESRLLFIRDVGLGSGSHDYLSI